MGDCLTMAITFPASPADGATYTNPTTGVQYIYNTADGVWKTYVWPTNTNYLQLTGGTLTGDLALGTNDLSAQDITSTTLTTTGAITSGGNIVMASGNGIDFSANANDAGMTSELLDDYEEGNWTPGVESGGWSGINSNSLTAKYVKIGRLVHVQAYIEGLTGSGNGTAMRLNGLPFSTISLGYSAGSVDVGKGSVKGMYIRTETNSDRIGFYYPSESSASRIAPNGNSFYDDGYIILHLSYFTNS